MNSEISPLRIRHINANDINLDGDFILYCMISTRRLKWNFGLKYSVEMSRKLDKPIMVVESLNINHKWASDRIHNFVINGIR